MRNKHTILLFLLLGISFQVSAQQAEIELTFEDFRPEETVRVYFHSGDAYYFTPKDGTQTLNIELEKPIRGLISFRKSTGVFLKARKYEIYIDPGKTKIKLYRDQFKQRIEVEGSPSHEVFHNWLKAG